MKGYCEMDNRYARQILFKPIGVLGQEQLSKSTITIIGCGALGSANAEMLVRAGVGRIHLADRDYVEASNLQRQQLFTEQDALDMIPKVVAAERRLRAIRSDVQIATYFQDVDSNLIQNLARKSAVIIDATDNFETRFLINDAAFKFGIPWIYGACVGSSGAVFPFIPSQTACFRCLFPILPSGNATCDTAGIISPAVQLTAALQSTETLKWLTGNKEALRLKVHHFDVWLNSQLDIGVTRIKRKECKTCGEHRSYPSLSFLKDEQIAVLCGRNAVQIIPEQHRFVSLDEAEVVGRRVHSIIKRTPYFVQLSMQDYRLIVFGDGRLLIHGMKDIRKAKKLYVDLFG